MTKTEKVNRARVLSGVASAILGVAGFLMEIMPMMALALCFSAAWLVLCVVSVNITLDAQIEAAAPRKGQHRRNK